MFAINFTMDSVKIIPLIDVRIWWIQFIYSFSGGMDNLSLIKWSWGTILKSLQKWLVWVKGTNVFMHHINCVTRIHNSVD